MKNLFKYAVLSGVVAVAAACTKDNTVDAVGPRTEYRMTNITIEAQTVDADSRTTVEGNALVWQDKDSEQSIAAVELWDGELAGGVDGSFDSYRVSKLDCADVTDGKALFSGKIAGKSGDDDSYTRGYIAAYPYAAFASVSGTDVEMTLPAEQTPAAVDDIDPAATLLFASDLEGTNETPESLSLFFKHVAAYGRIRVKNMNLKNGENILKLVIEANDSEALAGSWKFDYTDEELAGARGNEIYNSINLHVADLDTTTAATEDGAAFFFAALPCELDSFTVTAVTNFGRVFTKPISNQLAFERAKVEAFSVNFDGILASVTVDAALKLKIASGEANQQHSGSPIENLFDGETNYTSDGYIYHSPWSGTTTTFPVELAFKFDFPSSVYYFKYYTRYDTGGIPTAFDVQYRCNGDDANTWHNVNENYSGAAETAQFNLAEAEVAEDNKIRVIRFDKALENVVEIKLVIYSSDNNFVAGREIEFYGDDKGTNFNTARLVADCRNSSSYTPIAFGAGYEELNNVPVKPEVKVVLDYPATEDITLKVLYSGTVQGGTIENNATVDVTIPKGQLSAVVPFEIKSRESLEKGSHFTMTLSYEGSGIRIPESGKSIFSFIDNNFQNLLTLKPANYSCPFDGSYSGEGDGIGALCDKDSYSKLGTIYWLDDDYSQSVFEEYKSETAIYGVYVDINLPKSVAAVKLRHQNRPQGSLNGQPRSLKIGADGGNGFEVIGTMTDGFNSDYSGWTATPMYYTDKYFDKVRFGVTTSFVNDEIKNLCTNPEGSMCIAELEVYVMY